MNKQMKFKKNMLISLDEDKENKYIIVEELLKNKKQYLLLTEFNGKIEGNVAKNIKLDYKKCFLVCYNIETGEVAYSTDKEKITLLVKKAFNID